VCQVLSVARPVESGAGITMMPRVDLRLKPVSPREKFSVARTQAADQGRKAAPEMTFLDSRPGNCLAIDEIVENSVDFQAVDPDALGCFDGLWH